MNSVFVYCEIEGKTVKDVSLELLTKGRSSPILLAYSWSVSAPALASMVSRTR